MRRHAGGDSLDDPHEMLVVPKTDRRALQLAESLEIDLVEAVDQDIGHRGIGHQGGQRPDSQGLFEQVVGQALLLELVQRDIFGLQHTVHELADLGFELRLVHSQQATLVDLIEQAPVQLSLDRQVLGLAGS